VGVVGAVTNSASSEPWQPGHRAMLRNKSQVTAQHRSSQAVHVLAVKGATSGERRLQVLYNDERCEDGVLESQLIGEAHAPATGFNSTQKPAAAGRRCVGVRTGDIAAQRCNVLRVVDAATTNLAVLMLPRSTNVSLELCVELVTRPSAAAKARVRRRGSSASTGSEGSEGRPGSEGRLESGSDGASEAEEAQRAEHGSAEESFNTRVQAAGEAISVMDPPSTPPAPRFLLDLMFEIGKVAVGLTPEERPLATRLASLVLEYLLVGGVVCSSTLLDNFDRFANIRTSQAARAYKGAKEAAWCDKLLQPVRTLLVQLARGDVLANTQENEDEGEGVWAYAACDGQQCALNAVWRFFDVEHDGLRRCIERYERMRPPLACATRKRVVLLKPPTAPNPLWKLG